MKLLLWFELLWILLYAIACIWTFSLGSIADAVRTDVTSLDRHILTLITVLGICRTTTKTVWISVVLVLSLLRDVLNMVEIIHLSGLRAFSGLWEFTVVVVSYQTGITLVTLVWYQFHRAIRRNVAFQFK